ncbi:MAG: hypothetical protein K9N49_04320 [Candidatus Marinimicrobia bacterium]|nr:hypothetical protein [Candidatus Neomarinimicrobiota bacterium]
MRKAKKCLALALAWACGVGQIAWTAQPAPVEEYSETVYVIDAPEEEPETKRAWLPWIVGGALVGGGVAAVIINQDDKKDKPTPEPAPEPTACTEAALLGTWYAETAENNRTGWYMTFRSGGRADFQRITDLDDPDASMVETFPGTVNAWTLDTNTCVVTVNSPISGQSGNGILSNRSLTIASKMYQKR